MSKITPPLYDSKLIRVLRNLDPVRERPGMYIGSTDQSGVFKMFSEVFDNSVDEAISNYCNKIVVIIRSDNSVEIQDNGRGMPTDVHHEEGISSVEVILTTLHSGGKFGDGAYEFSTGLHGVGLSVVNALSAKLEVNVYKNNQQYFIRCFEGVPEQHLQVVGATTLQGTTVKFWPSSKYFDDIVYNHEAIVSRIEELSYLLPELTIEYVNEIVDYKNVFNNQAGLKGLLMRANGTKKSIIAPIYIMGMKDNIHFDTWFFWNETEDEKVVCYTNFVQQPDGGYHLFGLRSGLAKVLMPCIPNSVKDIVTNDDIKAGLVSIILVKMKNPQFSSQTKEKLGSRIVKGVVEEGIRERFGEWGEKNPSELRKIVNKIILTAENRKAALSSKKIARSEFDDIAILPGKLTDCQTRDPVISEIYLVEGDSAGGSAKMARDRRTQAILPVQGKILNTERATERQMLNFVEICNIIKALGASVGKNFNISKLRYHKVIMMADADVDGSHISALLLTFFWRHMRQLIIHGYLFLALPPLYLVRSGKTSQYLHDEKALYEYISKMVGNTIIVSDWSKQDLEQVVSLGSKLKDALNTVRDVPPMVVEQFFLHCYCNGLSYAKAHHETEMADKVFDDSVNMDWEKLLAGSSQSFSTSEATEELLTHETLSGSDDDAIEMENVDYQVDDVFSMPVEKDMIFEPLLDDFSLPEMIDISSKSFISFAQRMKYIRDIENSTWDCYWSDHNIVVINISGRRTVYSCESLWQKYFYIAELVQPIAHLFDGRTNFENLRLISISLFIEKITKSVRKNFEIQRYKGLGEMNPDQLREVALAKETRHIVQINISHAEKADKLFTDLMGSDVSMRRKIVQEMAQFVRNIDV